MSTLEKNAAYESMMELSRLLAEVAERFAPEVERAAEILAESLKAGGKVLACGNGGSAADAQHFTGELVGRFLYNRPPLAGITLSADTSVMTAIGNDYGFEQVFSRQVEGLGKAGDVLVGFSTSGTSPNVIEAFNVAQEMGLRTVAFVGPAEHEVVVKCDSRFHVPSKMTPRIQEVHQALFHALCESVEKKMFPRDSA